MRYLYLATLLVAGLIVMSSTAPGIAQQSGALSYNLSNAPTTTTATSFNATVGGVQGTIKTTAGGSWTMSVAGQKFASGTYSCGGGSCSFTATTLAGKSVSFAMTHSTGTVSGVFPNHGAWVSSVTAWANGHLTARQKGEVVSQAAGGKAHDPTRDVSHGSAQGASQGAPSLDRGSHGNADSAEHGGGEGRGK